MKKRNETRRQILLQLITKSDKIIDDIIKLRTQIYLIQPKRYKEFNKASLSNTYNSPSNQKN